MEKKAGEHIFLEQRAICNPEKTAEQNRDECPDMFLFAVEVN